MNISNTVGTFELERKMPSFLNQVNTGFLRRLKLLIKLLLLLLLAIWTMFLCAGLIISIFGANLQQQKFASGNKIDTNEFVLRACQSKSVNGSADILDKKIMPDAAQCLGSKFRSLIK